MGRKNNKNSRKNNSFSRKNTKTFKKDKPARDIKHVLQRKSWKEASVRSKPLPTVVDEEEPMHVDTLDQLLSTFSDLRQKNKLKAVESDSEDDSNDEDGRSHDGDNPNSNGVNLEGRLEFHSDSEDIESETADGNEDPVEENNEEVDQDNEEADQDEEEVDQDDDQKNDGASDPYAQHFMGNLPSSLLASLDPATKNVSTHSLEWPALGKVKISIPVHEKLLQPFSTSLEEQQFVEQGQVPKRIVNIEWNALGVKSQITANLKTINVHDGPEDLTTFQSEIFSILNNYQDLLLPQRTHENGEAIRFVYCLHIVNHILKVRNRVTRHNERISKMDKANGDMPDEFRDQGLVRPRVLILTPFRDSAYRVVNMMSKILFGSKKQNVANKTRFDEEYTGSELLLPKRNRKPEDFEQLFTGNVDDSFKIGLSFTKKSMKLYSDFYSSDVLIASPLGVRMLIGAEGEHGRDYDFLASIEILVMDQTEVFLMQNWDHIVHLMNHIHLQPKDSHGTDFSRVQLWALNGWARHYRQSLIFSSVLTPEINALYARHCSNYAGAARVTHISEGAISQVLVTLPHVYRRFKCSSIVDASDERFQFFTEEILLQFSELNGVLIYVPSYFDFVRLRNFFKAKDYSFVQISEYAKDGKVARARDMFFHNEARFLLYSERFHFYRRVNVKGIRHLVFYQPPTFPHFYSELSNMMQEANQNQAVDDGSQTVTVVLSQYDVHSLAGIVRAPRAARIINSDKSVFMFTTGKT